MSQPKKGTPEWDLWIAAIEVAIYPPLTNASGQATAQVSWALLKTLRASLDALGIDWREAKRKDDAHRKEVRRRFAEEARAAAIERQRPQ